jgi:hypothetical protein
MGNNIVVYTAIFGDYDDLLPQVKLQGVDFICFTDRPFKSKIWKIVKIDTEFQDMARDNRKIKILAHRYLPEYDYSIFMDGNFLIKKKALDLIRELDKHKMLVFDHAQCSDARDCIYEELEAILEEKRKTGKEKDDPQTMINQIGRFKKEGYPPANGLISGGVLIRRHLDAEVMKVMESWWKVIETGSKRDQLSFNYVAWKHQFPFKYISGDIRNNEYFTMIGKPRASYKGKYFRYRLKKFFGLKK